MELLSNSLRFQQRCLVLAALVAMMALVVAACGGSEPDFNPDEFDPLTIQPAGIDVFSPVIRPSGSVPVRFTCDGNNEAPLISWQRPPDGTRAMAFIMDDPDAPGRIFSHWIAYNIDPAENTTNRLIEGRSDALAGENDFGDLGYGGPCPPRGETHEYRFSIYALTAPVALEEGAKASELLAAMRGSVIGFGALSAEYTRQ